MTDKYVTLKRVLEYHAHYNLLIGERSNGKTFAVLCQAVKEFHENGSQLAYIRRWGEDIRAKRMAKLFDALVKHDKIHELTKGLWDKVIYNNGDWYLAKRGEKEDIVCEHPFATCFCITDMEHDKSLPFPNIRNVLYDEFLTRRYYLPDEFILFQNVLSTIIRERDDVTIYMCGNTVNQYCPYFREMGLRNITSMKQGDMELYRYGDSPLKVLVYFTDSVKGGKKSDVYFAFDNPKLSMITGKGGNVWEMDIYPHLPVKYTPSMIMCNYYIVFDGHTLECDVVQDGNNYFTYIHRKTTPLKYPDRDLIFSFQPSPSYNWRQNVNKPVDKIGKKIATMFSHKRVFYQDNEVGEIVRNYLTQCGAYATSQAAHY